MLSLIKLCKGFSVKLRTWIQEEKLMKEKVDHVKYMITLLGGG
jgi:hypothetical protein